MRSVKTGIRTPEYVAAMKLALSVLLENLKVMSTLEAINNTANVLKLDDTDRNLLIEILKTHRRKLRTK